MKTIILHLDMNSYFASVEQQANPFLRGKPVGVCATMGSNGCIIASSKEAKAKGIKTGCRVRDALFLDPDVILVENDSKKYRSTTERIIRILKRYTDSIELYSIDEAFLDLTGWVATLDEAADIGKTIQTTINEKVGEWLSCSIGIAQTRWLAKFAGDTAEKGSVLILRKEDLPAYYETRKLTDAWGINVRMERRLNALDIFTLNELRTFDPYRLMRSLGRYGYLLWANINGIPTDGLETERAGEPKSIGHSHVLTTARKVPGAARAVLMKLCEKTGRRLRQSNLQARGLSVWWGFTDGGGFHRSFKTGRPVFDTMDIFLPAEKLFQQTTEGHEILSIAVSTFLLSPRVHQLSLFEDVIGRDAVICAADRVNDRWGEYTLTRGSMWKTGRFAPDRIGFRKTSLFSATLAG